MRGWARALGNETTRWLLVLWSYRFELVMEFVGNSVMFGALALLFADESAARVESRASMLVGWLVTMLGIHAIVTMAWGLRREMQEGTLEQMALGAHPVGWLVVGRFTGELWWSRWRRSGRWCWRCAGCWASGCRWTWRGCRWWRSCWRACTDSAMCWAG